MIVGIGDRVVSVSRTFLFGLVMVAAVRMMETLTTFAGTTVGRTLARLWRMSERPRPTLTL